MRMGTPSEEPGSPGDLLGSHLRPPEGPELGVSATLSPVSILTKTMFPSHSSTELPRDAGKGARQVSLRTYYG